MKKVQPVKHFFFSSLSNPNRQYKTSVFPDGHVSCNCPSWIFKKANKPCGCLHTKSIANLMASETPITRRRAVRGYAI